MSNTSYHSELVCCPYFHRATPQTLVCEGPRMNSTVTMRFATKEDIQNHRKAYCDGWTHKNCPLYRSAALKYD